QRFKYKRSDPLGNGGRSRDLMTLAVLVRRCILTRAKVFERQTREPARILRAKDMHRGGCDRLAAFIHEIDIAASRLVRRRAAEEDAALERPFRRPLLVEQQTRRDTGTFGKPEQSIKRPRVAGPGILLDSAVLSKFMFRHLSSGEPSKADRYCMWATSSPTSGKPSP
ncbi:MAG: hypothetical protein Q9173_003950, partial [Seirophora scorigena]